MTKPADQRLAAGRYWLAAGLSTQETARRIMRRFGVAQSTAYEDVRRAGEANDRDDDGPASDDVGADCDLIPGLILAINEALADGDYSSVNRLVGALDKVKRWRGQDGPDNPFRVPPPQH
jgi:hypothetical protein